MKMLTFAHDTGMYALSDSQVAELLKKAVRIRQAGQKVIPALHEMGIEARLLDCIEESSPWLYQNVIALGTRHGVRPIVAVPPDWAATLDSGWKLVD